MKCAVHTDTDAVGTCVNCGNAVCSSCRVVVNDKTYCRPCVNKLFVKKGARSGKLTTGSILGIVSGVLGLIVGIALVASGGRATEQVGATTNWAEIGYGIALIIVGLMAIAGCRVALTRKYFGLALAGGICAVLTFWLLGIPALILIIISRNEFVSPETKLNP